MDKSGRSEIKLTLGGRTTRYSQAPVKQSKTTQVQNMQQNFRKSLKIGCLGPGDGLKSLILG